MASHTKHTWKRVYFAKPTWCFLCGKFVWGVTKKQGLECTTCHAQIHLKCEEAATRAVDTFKCSASERARDLERLRGSSVSTQSFIPLEGYERVPKEREALLAEAKARRKANNAAGAASLLMEAVANNDDFSRDTEVRVVLVEALLDAERVQEAALQVSELLALDFQSADGYILKARVCVATNNLGGARTSYGMARSLSPSHAALPAVLDAIERAEAGTGAGAGAGAGGEDGSGGGGGGSGGGGGEGPGRPGPGVLLQRLFEGSESGAVQWPKIVAQLAECTSVLPDQEAAVRSLRMLLDVPQTAGAGMDDHVSVPCARWMALTTWMKPLADGYDEAVSLAAEAKAGAPRPSPVPESVKADIESAYVRSPTAEEIDSAAAGVGELEILEDLADAPEDGDSASSPSLPPSSSSSSSSGKGHRRSRSRDHRSKHDKKSISSSGGHHRRRSRSSSKAEPVDSSDADGASASAAAAAVPAPRQVRMTGIDAILRWALVALSHASFRGFMSSDDAVKALNDSPPGTWIMRFSGSPAHLTITVKVADPAKQAVHNRFPVTWTTDNVTFDTVIMLHLLNTSARGDNVLEELHTHGKQHAVHPSDATLLADPLPFNTDP